jgi:excinuclease ABC subunit C
VRFADQLTMLADDCQPGCLRGDVGTCLAPCAGDRDKASYLQGVADARAFLDGRDRQIIDRFEAAMHQAAAEQRYEQAAANRDTWQSLCALWDQLAMVRTAGSDHAGVHVLSGRSGKSWWALIAGGKVTSIVRQPSSKRAARQCQRLLDDTFPNSDAGVASNRGESDDYEQMRIVVSWYRQHPELLSMVMPPKQAQGICQQHCGNHSSGRSSSA